MKTDGRKRARWSAAAGIVGVLSLALAWGRMPAGRTLVPGPLPRELSDLAVACLASGEVRPALAELSDADLAAIVEIVARLIGAYERADFNSFLALRAGDLENASRRRSGDVESLRGLARELAVPPEELRGGWVEVLERFWNSYYDRPPILRFVPEGTRIELHSEGLGGRSLETWSASFEDLRDRVPGPWIQHELTVPHRRETERVARDSGPLRWVDLELPFETHGGLGARLVARFVWDGVLREWFLQDAATVYADGDRSQRHLIL